MMYILLVTTTFAIKTVGLLNMAQCRIGEGTIPRKSVKERCRSLVEVVGKNRAWNATTSHVGIRISTPCIFLDDFLRLNKVVTADEWLLVDGGPS